MPRALGATSSKMTSQSRARMIEAAGKLASKNEIAKIGGINRKTLWDWMKKEEVEAAARANEPHDYEYDELSIYGQFYVDMERAAAEKGLELLERIDEASKDPRIWAAAMTLLERRWPNHWSRRSASGKTSPLVAHIEIVTRAESGLTDDPHQYASRVVQESMIGQPAPNLRR